ncbi:FAD-dependent oxidoreductase [soil metagenome]
MKVPVVVIGAGLAGLRIASLLASQGIECRVLEARSRTGGRILTKGVAGQEPLGTYDLGPTWFWPEDQPRISRLITELGLRTFAQATQGVMLVERLRHERPQRCASSGDTTTGALRLVEGTGVLIDALGATLPEGVVQTDASVTSIRQESTESVAIEIGNEGDTLRASVAVVALPPRLAAQRIRFDPALPSDLCASLLSKPTWYGGQAKAVAVHDRPFWREAGLSGFATSAAGPLAEIHDASPPSGAGALVGFFVLPPKERQELGEGAVRDLVAKQLTRLFGSPAAHPIALLYKDWATDPETAVEDDLQPTNADPAYGPPSNAPIWNGRLVFAGTETAPEHGGYLEGALLSAESAVSQIIAALESREGGVLRG